MQRQTADMVNNESVITSFGHVTRCLAGIFHVETSAGVVRARQAAGCLITPETGDKVLVASDTDGDGYILNILERSRETEAVITSPHGLRFSAPHGSISLAAGRDVRMTTNHLELNAVSGSATVLDFQWTGRTLSAGLQKARLAVEALESRMDTAVQRVRRSYRYVAQLEQACLGRLRYLVDGSCFMKGRNTSLMADEKVKIDADSIDLG